MCPLHLGRLLDKANHFFLRATRHLKAWHSTKRSSPVFVEAVDNGFTEVRFLISLQMMCMRWLGQQGQATFSTECYKRKIKSFIEILSDLTQQYRITSQTMVMWCIRLTRLTLACEVIRSHWFKSDKISKKKDFSGWRPAITFLYLFLFHSLLRLTSFLSPNKNRRKVIKVHQNGKLGIFRKPSLVCTFWRDVNFAKTLLLTISHENHWQNSDFIMSTVWQPQVCLPYFSKPSTPVMQTVFQ